MADSAGRSAGETREAESNSRDVQSAFQILHIDGVDFWRLVALCLLVVLGWWVAQSLINVELDKRLGVSSPSEAEIIKALPGLSPAIGACYWQGTKATSIVIAVALGLSLGVTYLFGTFLYKKFRETSSEERQKFWSAVHERMKELNHGDLRDMVGEFREYEKVILDRRNIYWSLFVRMALAILVVGLIALLISTCRVESQAGLPIISGIIAFIIGQGSELIHAATAPVLLSPSRGTQGRDGSVETPKANPPRDQPRPGDPPLPKAPAG